MAIHYDAKLKRFRDSSGRIVAKARAVKSSIARAEYLRAQKKPRPKSKPKPAPKPAPKPKPQAKRVSHAKPKTAPKDKQRVAPWERQGIVREHPAPEEWFPDSDVADYDYDYDDLIEDWGDFGDDETHS